MTNRSIPALILILVFGFTTISCGTGNHLVSIAVTPNPANLNAPATLQLQAVGKYSDGTTQPLSSATWTLVSPPPFVTLDKNGLVTCSGSGGPLSGATMAIASFAGLSGSARLLCSGPGV
jgi:hypothetical protein